MFTPNKSGIDIIYSGDSLEEGIAAMSKDMCSKAAAMTFIPQEQHERELMQALNMNVRLNGLYVQLISRAIDKIPYGKHTEEAVTMLMNLQRAMRGET